MANHKSAIKRIRSDEEKKLRNKYQAKTARNMVRRLRNTKDKKEAAELLPKASSLLDKLAKKNLIHKKKAGHLKSKLTKHTNSL